MTLSSLVLVLVLLVTVSVHGIPRALSAHSAVSISEQELLQLKRASNEAETTFGASSCGAAIALYALNPRTTTSCIHLDTDTCHPNTLSTRYNLGERERVSGLYAEAAVHLHRAIDLSVNLGCGPGGCAGAASLHSLGAALAATGDPASLQAAMPLLARALRAARAHCGDAAPETIDVLSTQGALAKARGRSSQAIAILRQALQLVEGHAGAPVGGVLTNLGLVLHASGATSDAVATLERAVAMTEAEAVAATTATVTGDGDTAVTPPPLELVQPLQALALALLDAPPSVATDGSSSSSGGGGSSGTGGHVVRAVRLLKRALGILDAHFEGGLHPQHAPVLTALAEALGRGWGAAKAKRRLELLERALQATEARHEELVTHTQQGLSRFSPSATDNATVHVCCSQLVAVSAGEASPASAAASAAAVAAAAANVAAVRGESGDVLGQVQALESSAATLEVRAREWLCVVLHTLMTAPLLCANLLREC